MNEIISNRVLIRVAYDGTNYHGFQENDGVNTIMGALSGAIKSFSSKNIELIGASRTDTGVHALGNVVVFDNITNIPTEKLPLAINTRLPNDIKIVSAMNVDNEFHPRYCDVVKTYSYYIKNREIPFPTESRYAWQLKNLDISKMKLAVKDFEGTHDFIGFATKRKEGYSSTIRTIYKSELIENDENSIQIRLLGNGFLYNMVRIIVGTLVEIGLNRKAPSVIKEVLEKRDRKLSGMTAPPQGLFLDNIKYLDFE